MTGKSINQSVNHSTFLLSAQRKKVPALCCLPLPATLRVRASILAPLINSPTVSNSCFTPLVQGKLAFKLRYFREVNHESAGIEHALAC